MCWSDFKWILLEVAILTLGTAVHRNTSSVLLVTNVALFALTHVDEALISADLKRVQSAEVIAVEF